MNAEYIADMRYFRQLTLSDFKITEKGQKLFSEGAIPTGVPKKKRATVFYSPVHKEYTPECKQSISPIATSFLGESFMDKIEIDVSDIEEYIKSVQTRFGLKKEEFIFNEEHEKPKVYAAKTEENLKIQIGENEVTFAFETTKEKAFFEKYYSASLMSKGMLAKEKYKFSKPVPTVDLETCRINNLYIPDDTKKQVARPCKLFINRGRLGFDRDDNVMRFEGNGELLDLLDDNAEFALLDLSGCKYYTPVNVRMPSANFDDDFEMQLLVETVADYDSFTKLLQTILGYCYDAEYTTEIGKIVAYIAMVEKNPDYLLNYASKRMLETKNAEERLELLLKLNSSFEKVEGWKVRFEELAKTEFENYASDVSIENAIFKNTMLSPLKAAMGIDSLEYLRTFAKNIEEEEPTVAFQALSACGFDLKQVLTVVNVVPVFMASVLDGTDIDSPTELGMKYQLVNSNLSKICDLLGIDNPTDYTVRVDYNIDEFFEANATFASAVKAIEGYRSYAKEEYAVLDQYCTIIKREQDTQSAERAASEHPDKITKELIQKQIAQGSYNSAISTLFVKLQYDLRILLKADSSLKAYDLIKMARDRKMIDQKEADILHKFRLCRDAIQHPDKKQIKYTEDDLAVFTEVTFRLKGEKK